MMYLVERESKNEYVNRHCGRLGDLFKAEVKVKNALSDYLVNVFCKFLFYLKPWLISFSCW
jgi:hypothetical protein